MLLMSGMSFLNELDLNLLVALRALLRERSVTQAARRLGITQPAMSHKLRRLREELADPLFVPAGRGLAPTPRALAIESPLNEALEALERAVQREEFDPASAQRTFRVGTSDYGEAKVLPVAVRRIQRAAPGISIQTHPVGPNVGTALERGELHIAIGAGMPTPKGAKRVTLLEEGFVVLARRGHPHLANGLDLATYAKCDHVVVAPRGAPGTFVDAALTRMGKARRIVARVRSFLSAPFVVATSEALLTAPSGLAALLAESLDLDVYEPPLPLAPVPIWMIWHPRFHDDPGHRWLRQMAVDLVQESRG